jgi:hypothetical protein
MEARLIRLGARHMGVGTPAQKFWHLVDLKRGYRIDVLETFDVDVDICMYNGKIRRRRNRSFN